MSKEKDEIVLKKKPHELKNLGVAYNDESFLLAFNCDEDNIPEESFVIPSEALQGVVGLLFEAGITFQRERKVDIGFGEITKED